MGRIRSIKPDWLDDEGLLSCSAEARVLSVALLLLADDYGNGRAGHMVLGARVFPVNPGVVVDAMAELVRIRFASRYTCRGQAYYSVRNWDKHQRVDHPSDRGRVPGPDDPDSVADDVHPSGVTPRIDSGQEALAEVSRGLARVPESLVTLPDLTRSHPSSKQGSTSQFQLSSPSASALSSEPSGRSDRKRARVAPDVPKELKSSWLPDDEQVAALAAKYSVTAERIRVQVPEFIWFWTKGKRAGTKRTLRGWSQAFGKRVDQLAQAGLLYVERPSGQVNGQSTPAPLVTEADVDRMLGKAAS